MQRHRREFFELCCLAGLGVAVPLRYPLLSRAAGKNEPYAGPYYMVFNASGGWDTTYLMDPKGVRGINRLYKEGDIQTQGAHKYAPTAKHIKGGLSNEGTWLPRSGQTRSCRVGMAPLIHPHYER